MRAEYKYTVRSDDLADLADLTDRATEYEEIRREEAKEKQAARKGVSAAKASEEYDRANTCWRCKQRGHDRFNCRRPAKRFCSQCGKDGVRTQDCHPRPGNAATARGQLRVKFTPRPHITIRLLDRLVPALLDSGSEISIINAETARRARDMRIRPIVGEEEIHLADGTRANIPGRVSLPFTVQGKTLRHTFSILPTLDSPVLIGIDLWARLGLTIPSPPRKHIAARKKPQLKELFGDLFDLSDDGASTEAQTPRIDEAHDSPTGPPATYGPSGPPPIEVVVGGMSIMVPYFAAIITRKYRTRIGNRKIVMRFDRTGRCVYSREL